MRKTFFLLFCTIIFLFPFRVFPGESAKVIGKSGEYLVIDKGEKHGVKIGMQGTFKKVFVDSDGTKYDIRMGFFQVKEVNDNTARLLMTKLGDGMNAGEAEFVVFRDTLMSPGKQGERRSLEWYLREGERFFNRGDYNTAKKYFQKALSIDKRDPIAKSKINQCDEKIAFLEKEKKFTSYLERAAAYLDKNNVEYALDYYFTAYEFMPSKVEVVAAALKKISNDYKGEWKKYLEKKKNLEKVRKFPAEYRLTGKILPEYVNKIPIFERLKAASQKMEKNEKGFAEFLLDDDILMVYIPAGKFQMGSGKYLFYQSTGKGGRVQERSFTVEDDECPQHEVFINGFFMSKYEITQKQFVQFLNSLSGDKIIIKQGWLYDSREKIVKIYNDVNHIHYDLNAGERRFSVDRGYARHPVTSVTREGAGEFCRWLSYKIGLKFRLPTEAEWEKAARGSDRRPFPWGTQSPDFNGNYYANFRQEPGIKDGFKETASVEAFRTLDESPYGILNMAGNVSEWVVDYYKKNYYKTSPKNNPVNAKAFFLNRKGVVRGGNWQSDLRNLRVTRRIKLDPKYPGMVVGFRVAMDEK